MEDSGMELWPVGSHELEITSIKGMLDGKIYYFCCEECKQ